MEHEYFLQIVLIIILGVTSQWIANILKLPAIVFFLTAGFLAGPVYNIINPELLLGELLFPFVAFSVAIILFEGGMDLNMHELKSEGKAIGKIIFIGGLVTWILSTLAGYFILKLNIGLALLVGAILIVTGPTVITPMVKHIRPKRNIGHILKWEGIVNDPIGVILAVLILQTILVGQFSSAGWIIAGGILKTIFLSVGISVVFTSILVFCFKKYWVADDLKHAVVFMFVLLAKYLSDHSLPESGLLTVTLMGVMFANQKFVSTRNILEFKEKLRTLILSSLFIILSARLNLESFNNMGWEHVGYFTFLIFIIRPASIFMATHKTNLTWKEKLFMSFLAPRGIVAVATGTIFTHELLKVNYPQAALLEPLVFMIVIVTVVVYGFGAPILANFLKLHDSNAQGVLFIGAHPWARKLAEKLKSLGIDVMLLDSNSKNVELAKKAGLKAIKRNVLSDDLHEEVDFEGIGKVLAITPNDEANSLTCLRFREIFNSSNTFQIYPEHEETGEKPHFFEGRFLFDQDMTFDEIDKLFRKEKDVMLISVDKDVNSKDFRSQHQAMPLFIVKDNKSLEIMTSDDDVEFKKDDTVIAILKT